MLAFPIAAWRLHPDWTAAARGLIPSLPSTGARGHLLYAYFAVGMLSSIMLPYEVYFYSSGGIEDGWKPAELLTDRVTAVIGFTAPCWPSGSCSRARSCFWREAVSRTVRARRRYYRPS